MRKGRKLKVDGWGQVYSLVRVTTPSAIFLACVRHKRWYNCTIGFKHEFAEARNRIIVFTAVALTLKKDSESIQLLFPKFQIFMKNSPIRKAFSAKWSVFALRCIESRFIITIKNPYQSVQTWYGIQKITKVSAIVKDSWIEGNFVHGMGLVPPVPHRFPTPSK